MRAYMAQSRGVMPGRGQRAGDPFLGIGAFVGGVKLAKRALTKIAPKKFGALRPPSIGQIIQGTKFPYFGRNPMKFGPLLGPGMGGVRRRYRRINAGNAKALRRAFRRIEAFGKLASKAGYVRRRPAGHFKKSRSR